MAVKKISELTSVSSLTGTELIPMVQSGTTKQATLNDVRGLTNVTLKYATLKMNLTSGFPTNGADIPFAQSVVQDTIDSNQKLSNFRIQLKANRTYKFDGGVEVVSADAGVFTAQFQVNETGSFQNVHDGYVYNINGSGADIRNYRAGGFYTPSQDCEVRLLCTNNTLTNTSQIYTEFTVSEYSFEPGTNVLSGTYTPQVLINGTNLNTGAITTAHYRVVGDMVHVSGRLDLVGSSDNTNNVELELPFPQITSSGYQDSVAGTHSVTNRLSGMFLMEGVNSGNRVKLQNFATSANVTGQELTNNASSVWRFQLSYIKS